MRGYFEIGIYHNKTPANLGTLWRSAFQLGAAGIFVIGKRFPKQASDCLKTWRHVPLREYADFDGYYQALPYDCRVVAIEMGGKPLAGFNHPERASYLLGAEDHGLPAEIMAKCHLVVNLESVNTNSYNVAVAGSLVMYHRVFL